MKYISTILVFLFLRLERTSQYHALICCFQFLEIRRKEPSESQLVARSAGVKIKGPRFSGASILGQLHETEITSKRTSHITNCGAVARVAHACLTNILLTSGSATS